MGYHSMFMIQKRSLMITAWVLNFDRSSVTLSPLFQGFYGESLMPKEFQNRGRMTRPDCTVPTVSELSFFVRNVLFSAVNANKAMDLLNSRIQIDGK